VTPDAHLTALDSDGYTIPRGALPAEWIAPLRETFERLDLPGDAWPVPRERPTRHAMLDGDEGVHRVCGQQRLHRDWAHEDGRPTALVKALAFLDDFAAANGATRIVPGSHLEEGCAEDDPRQARIAGRGGDIVLFHGRLAHSGTRNVSGAKRRALQIWYHADV
jgi:hypothetical protein